MDRRRLEDHLAALQAELLAPGQADEQKRMRMRLLAAEIREMLDAEPSELRPEHYRGLSERLKEAVGDFEASHPKISTAMERVIDTLAFYNL